MSFLYRSPKLEVRKSDIAGVGVFAKENIKKGDIVAIKTGHVVNGQQLKDLGEDIWDWWFQIGDDFFLTPLTKEEGLETAIFINHSCDPNVGFSGDITFIAIKDISVGEELCFDYSMNVADPTFSFECKCGTKLCRKTVTGNDWKIKELQERYRMHFSWYILKKIKGWE